MPFIGNQPAESYSAFQKQDFSTSATTSYTLDHPVANQNEIALFINFVRQEPTTAYTASGTSLTLTSATSASDDMYCVYLGKAVQTVNPPSGSVGSSQVAASIITGQTALGATPADTDELLISDAGTLKRVDYSYLKSSMTPAFFATLSADQSLSNLSATKVQINNEIYDTANAYDNSSNYRFTPQTAGKYFVYGGIMINGDQDDDIEVAEFYFNKNSTVVSQSTFDSGTNYLREVPLTLQFSVDMNGSSDYLEMYVYGDFKNGGGTIKGHSTPRARTFFGAYKIIE